MAYHEEILELRRWVVEIPSEVKRAMADLAHSQRWGCVDRIWGKKIVVAWVLTFPGAALIGAAGYAFAHFATQPFIH